MADKDIKREQTEADRADIIENEGDGASRQERIRTIAKGTLTLAAPIRARSMDVTALSYDFMRLSGKEYADAMDKDSNIYGMMQMTKKQALYLFAAAAAKETENVDATDIIDRLGIQDSIKAVQLATVFFALSAQEANERITNG